MITENEAFKAAEMLKEWCDGLPCTLCPFTRNGIATGCIFRHHDLPHQWKIPNPRRWTDDDIQLAKILKKLGVYKISYSNTGGPWWNTDDTGGTVPIGAFADLKPGEGVPIDAIINEEPEEQVECRYSMGGGTDDL